MGDDDVEDEDIDAWLDSESEGTNEGTETEEAREEEDVVVEEEGAKDENVGDGKDDRDASPAPRASVARIRRSVSIVFANRLPA